LSERRIVLGLVRRSALASSHGDATAEELMESGPSTVRPNTPVSELVERLTKRELSMAIVTTPGGCLLGVFHRAAGERLMADAGPTDA
jgi:CBS-domain-containing membrane protein